MQECVGALFSSCAGSLRIYILSSLSLYTRLEGPLYPCDSYAFYSVFTLASYVPTISHSQNVSFVPIPRRYYHNEDGGLVKKNYKTCVDDRSKFFTKNFSWTLVFFQGLLEPLPCVWFWFLSNAILSSYQFFFSFAAIGFIVVRAFHSSSRFRTFFVNTPKLRWLSRDRKYPHMRNRQSSSWRWRSACWWRLAQMRTHRFVSSAYRRASSQPQRLKKKIFRAHELIVRARLCPSAP